MSSLIWSPRATADIQRLYRFLLPKNPEAARRAVKAIRGGVKILESQPQIGKPADNLPDEYRLWFIDFGSGGYAVLYRLDHATVTILAVRHQKEAGF